MVIIMIVMVTMVIMVIKVVRVASVKSSIGIFTHQGHISKVNANAQLLSNSVTQSMTLITSRGSCDANKERIFHGILRQLLHRPPFTFTGFLS